MKNETKFQNRYRILSNRLSGWDYSNEGAYFLTLCTCHRECLFGEIINHDMVLNDYGAIVQREWIYSAQLRPEILLDSYVIMPNHFHTIVHVVSNQSGGCPDGLSGGLFGGTSRVETHGCASLQNPVFHQNPISQQQPISHPPLYRTPKSVSSLMAGFKSVVTKQINIIRGTPGKKVWQANYYDHIIRNDKEYERIADYIEMNPELWQSDSLR